MKPLSSVARQTFGNLPLYLTLVVSAPLSEAATYNWTGAVDQNWFTAGNWQVSGSDLNPTPIPSIPHPTNLNKGSVVIPQGTTSARAGTILIGTTGLAELSIQSSAYLRNSFGFTVGSRGTVNVLEGAGLSIFKLEVLKGGNLIFSGVGANGKTTELTIESTASVQLKGSVKVLNGGDLTAGSNLHLVDGGNILVSGIHPGGVRSNYYFGHRMNIGDSIAQGRVTVMDGGLLRGVTLTMAPPAGNSGEVTALVTGVNVNGTSSEIQVETLLMGLLPGAANSSELTVSDGGLFSVGNIWHGTASINNANSIIRVSGVHSLGNISTFRADQYESTGTLVVTDGALADILNFTGNDQGKVLVSGAADNGNRSTLRAGLMGFSQTPSSSFRITDGGLLEANDLFMDQSDLAVGGVAANGTQSEWTVANDLRIQNGSSLAISGGGKVAAGHLFVTDGNLTLSGVHGSGKRSTFISEDIEIGSPDTVGSMDISNGAAAHADLVMMTGTGPSLLSIRGGTGAGSLEVAKITGGNGTPSIQLDGGLLRFSREGSPFEQWGQGTVELLQRGGSIDTMDHSNLLDVQLQGIGGLTKLGSGILELTAANTYQGNTTVSEGTLILNNTTGSATGSGDVRVLNLGAIGGNGYIAGNLVNKGLVSPTDPAGALAGDSQDVSGATLIVEGDYTQTRKGALRIVSFSPTDKGLLVVKGDVSLQGHLVFIPLDGSLKFGQSYRLLESTGTITGEFDNIRLFNFNGFRKVIETSENSVDLLVAPQSYTEVARSPNEISLASALNPWINDTSGDTQTVSDSLDRLSAAEYRPAFAAISPSLYGAALATGIEQSQSQSIALNQHLNSRRLREVPATDAGKCWEAWALASGLYSSGSMSSLAGQDFSSGSFLSGIERELDATFSAGAFTGYGASKGEFSGDSQTEQDRFTLGAYATAQRDGYYANSVLGFGVLEMDVTRSIRFGGLSRNAHSSTDGTEFFGLISGGYDFRQANWVFGPTGSLQYSKVRYDDAKERGAGALDLLIDNPEDDSLRSLLGGRVAYQHKASEQLTLIPEARVFWQHELLRDNETLDATLEQGNGSSFAHQLADSDGDSVYGGVALGFQTNFGFYGNVSYDIEIGRESELNHNLTIGADWRF